VEARAVFFAQRAANLRVKAAGAAWLTAYQAYVDRIEELSKVFEDLWAELLDEALHLMTQHDVILDPQQTAPKA
jgi:hypothetical protein